MPALAGVLSGRQAAGSATQTGTAFAVVPLQSPNGAATTLTPADGVEYLVLSFANTVSSSNTVGAETRCSFGSTVLARDASTMRFSTFNENPARGSAHGGLALITGNGTDAVTIEHASVGAADAVANGADLQLIPTSLLQDFSFVDDTNAMDPDAAVDMPLVGWTDVGDPLTFSPESDGDYIIISYLELFGNGADSGADVFATRLVLTVDGGADQIIQAANYHEREVAPAGGICHHNYRFHTFPNLSSASSYTYRLQANGTEGNGNLPARRVRHCKFRQDSFASVTPITSTAGIDTGAVAGQVDAFPGTSVTVPDPGEAGIVHLFLGDARSQTTVFTALRANIDSGASFLPRDGAYRGNDVNGFATTSDICHIHTQGSQVLAGGSTHAVELEAEHFSGGAVTYGRNRGSTADVPAEFAVIALQAPEVSSTDGAGSAEAIVDVSGLGAHDAWTWGESSSVVSSEAAGEPVFDGDGEAEVIAEPSATGAAIVAGAGEAFAVVEVAGTGAAVVAGAGEAVAIVEVIGIGGSNSLINGSGEATAIVDASGVGSQLTIVNGAGSADVVVDISGAGELVTIDDAWLTTILTSSNPFETRSS